MPLAKEVCYNLCDLSMGRTRPQRRRLLRGGMRWEPVAMARSVGSEKESRQGHDR